MMNERVLYANWRLSFQQSSNCDRGPIIIRFRDIYAEQARVCSHEFKIDLEPTNGSRRPGAV